METKLDGGMGAMSVSEEGAKEGLGSGVIFVGEKDGGHPCVVDS